MIRTWPSRLAAAASVATAVTLAGLAAPAFGSSSGVAGPGAAVAPQVAVYNSTTFAGYDQQQGGGTVLGTQTVAATVVVPTVTCGPPANRGITADVGIYGASSYYEAGVFVGCYGGHAHYWPHLIINGQETKYNVGADAKPGDTVSMTVSLGATQSSASVVDHSRPLTKTLTGAGSTSWSSPYVGNDARAQNGQLLGVPTFGMMTFSQCTFDGAAFGGPAASALIGDQRVNSANTVQISLGPFGPAHTGFGTYFRHY